MISLKVQIEIRYKHILNFQQDYKNVLAPHLKIANFSINNPGVFDESIFLQYQNEGFSIDVRWDRLVFICEGKKDNLFAANGQLFHFLKIFEDLKKLPSFVSVTNILLAEWTLFETDNSNEEILKEFKNKNVNSNISQFDQPLDDIAIILNFKEAENSFKITFGPFKPSSDINTYELNVISKEKTTLNDKRGILSQCIYVENSSDFNIDMLKRIDKKIVGFLKNLEGHV